MPPMTATPTRPHLDGTSAPRPKASISCARSPAQAARPVLLYSIGKDSSVLLHLALQGVLPRPAAVPAAAYRHDLEVPRHDPPSATRRSRKYGLELIVHTNPEGKRQNINPFDHGSSYTQIMKTDALKQALTDGRYDVRHRRRAARRGTLARQGTRVLGPRPRPHLGPEAPAAGTLAPLQRQPRARRDAARVPAVQLDRARRVDLHPGRGHRRRAAVFRRPAPDRGSATAR